MILFKVNYILLEKVQPDGIHYSNFKEKIMGLYEPIARRECDHVKRMSKFAEMTMLPKELTPKSTTFQQTVISRSLRIPNTVFRILVNVAVT